MLTEDFPASPTLMHVPVTHWYAAGWIDVWLALCQIQGCRALQSGGPQLNAVRSNHTQALPSAH